MLLPRTAQPGTHSRFRRTSWYTTYRSRVHTHERVGTWKLCAIVILSTVARFALPVVQMLAPSALGALCSSAAPWWTVVICTVWWVLGTGTLVVFALRIARFAGALIVYPLVVTMYVCALVATPYVDLSVLFPSCLVSLSLDWANTFSGCLLAPLTTATAIYTSVLTCVGCLCARTVLSLRVLTRRVLVRTHLLIVNCESLTKYIIDIIDWLPRGLHRVWVFRPIFFLCVWLAKCNLYCLHKLDWLMWTAADPFSNVTLFALDTLGAFVYCTAE